MIGIDYFFILFWVIFIAIVSILCRRISHSVSDFLSASRCAGRYMLCTATDMGTFAAIYIIAVFQQFYQSGFPGEWWNWLIIMPVMMILPMTGWVQYRYRESRAQTMPELFEMRYGRRFRIFSGILAFTAGILNYGIFPAVTARFLIYFCKMPQTVSVLGLEIGSFPLVMFGVLVFALFILLNGGQVSVMITDFLQGLMILFGFLIILFFILHRIGIDTIFESLLNAPPGNSKLNPFDQSEVSDFNIWFFLLLAFNRMYSWLAWPSTQGYMAAAITPHEAKMARVLAQWCYQLKQVVLIIVPLVAWVILNNPSLFPVESAGAMDALKAVNDPDLQKQLTVPLTLLQILPAGFVGLFAAIMIGAAVTTDNSFIHSWGGIFIQDVVAPLYKKPISQKQHIRLLKISVVGVAAFAFFWSMIFPLKEWIFMYFQITSSLFLSGAGIALVGALYWKKGTVQGAWGAIITGVSLSMAGILLRQFWTYIPGSLNYAPEFPINGVLVFTISAVCSTLVYVVISLLTCRENFNLDRMLHRGVYALEKPAAKEVPVKRRRTFAQCFGITPEFTRGDKIIYFSGYLWVLFFFALNIGGAFWNFVISPLPAGFWVGLWKSYLIIMSGVGVCVALWFTVGGLIDLKQLCRRLSTNRIDENDDGRVSESGEK